MNILVVDDQFSVVKGILSAVNFEKIGIDNVKSAYSSKEAKSIIGEFPIDIVLSDIEMPDETGLDLIRWINEKYPDIISIMLSSHADFSYAQESLKLGCFDYIVQPAPYDEIEASLKKAVNQIYHNRQEKQLYSYGKLYKTNELELTDRTVANLFSSSLENVTESVNLLNNLGFPIAMDSAIQLFVIEWFPYCHSDLDTFSNSSIRSTLKSALSKANLEYPIYSLMAINKFKQFVILLFSDNSANFPCTQFQCNVFFQHLAENLSPDIACYIGTPTTLSSARAELGKMHSFINDNVTEKPGIYQTSPDEEDFSSTMDISESVFRWEKLLNSKHNNLLRTEILSFIDKMIESNHANFQNLCNLHQRLTQIFFSYLDDNNINISNLFSEEYQYNDYMDGFKNVDAFKKSVNFMLHVLDTAQHESAPKNDVEKAKTYIVTNLSKNLSVSDVADYIHLSPEYFTKLFKKETGQNIKHYIMKTKVEVAKNLLENSNISVSMVALELGYDNFSHFTQIFKKYENVTPSEYRKIKKSTEKD
ncbi:MAG: helix-turn-helix domain-containing protein [Eubacteriales bacterium]